MTTLDTLRLLIAAEIPTDLDTIEASMREITARLLDLGHDDPTYTAGHARIDQLLTARGHALNELGLDRCRKLHDLPRWRVIPCHACAQTVRNERTTPGGDH